MPRRIVPLVLSVVLLVFFCSLSALAYTVPDDTIVYVTPSGNCYHREGCTYTDPDTVTPLPIYKADQTLRPCSRCHPDYLTGVYGSSSSSSSVSDSSSYSSSPPVSHSVENHVSSAVQEPTKQHKDLYITLPIIGALSGYIVFDRRDRARQAKQKSSPVSPAKPSAPSQPAPPVVPPPSADPPKPPADPTVYVSQRGSCYHKYPGCSGARYPIPLSLVGRRRPCYNCHPPAKPAPKPPADDQLRIPL